MLKCENCIYKKVCINGANYKNAEVCKDFINKNDAVLVKCVKNQAICFGETICPNCGIHLEETSKIITNEDDYDRLFYDFQPRFCANCGAKFKED